jgi:predicted dehydrogenase
VVQDKLFLPGIRALKSLVDGGFFGRILSVRGEFGYWVFEGDWRAAQRPSWNYRKEDGGGIVLDMFPHWTYLLERLFGAIEAVTARAVTHIPERWDEGAPGTTPPPTTPRTRSSSWPAAASPRSTPHGACAYTAASCSSSRSTAPRAARWPG